MADAKFHVMALRGFEKFTEGRLVEDMPRIVARICGICPWNHHLASAKATDKVFGVELPPTAVKLRRLAQHLSWIPDKLLHFYFLAAPDFLMGLNSDPSLRNVVGIAIQNPDLAKKVVHMRHQGRPASSPRSRWSVPDSWQSATRTWPRPSFPICFRWFDVSVAFYTWRRRPGVLN